jgi:diguanylate cyclase (GGDEF)-like protein
MRLTSRNDGRAPTVQWSPIWTGMYVSGALLLVFALDRATDAAPVQHLYYLPIILAGVRFRMRGGVTAALASIALYHLANPHLLTFRYGEQDFVQVALLVTVGVVTAKLTDDADRLRHLASTDDLTGLHNLRSFEIHLATMVRASRLEQAPMALLVLDVDRLKSLNDKYGHLAGAEGVRTVGHVIGRQLPPAAVACRYGGDVFAIAIPRCTPHEAQRLAEDLCRAVHDRAPVLAGRRFAVGTLTVSVGGTCTVADGGTLPAWSALDQDVDEALFRAADAALYRAKASGRNQARVNDREHAGSRLTHMKDTVPSP